MRIIPKTVKVKVEFFKNISVADVIIGLIGLGIIILLFLSNIGNEKFLIALGIACVFVGLYLPYDGQRFYMFFVTFAKYLFSIKKYSREFENSSSNVEFFIPFKDIKDGFIEYSEYSAGVLEIDPREFRLLSGYRQDQIIDNNFGKVIRSISGNTKASIVKIDRRLILDKYIKDEERKIDELKKLREAESITEEELSVRIRVINDRISIYNNLNTDSVIEKPYYYLVVYDKDKGVIKEILNSAVSDLLEAGMSSRILNDKQLGIFLKYTYTNNFNEKDVEDLQYEEFIKWIIPQNIQFTPKTTVVDGVEEFNFTVKNFPVSVLNAWGYQLFNIKDTKVVMNLEPYEKTKAVKMLDRALQELVGQSDQSYKASSILDRQTHINTLVSVLRLLSNDNETLFGVTLHVTVYNHNKNKESAKNIVKKIKRVFIEEGFDLSSNICKQNRAFISNTVSRYDSMSEYQRSIHSSSVAAVFPFVLSSVMDDKGVVLGQSNGFPVIVDFFKRDNERVNSNMVIMGKSGSGKSFSTKTILTGLAAENSKIFILDPENEYQYLAKNLGGRLIDVGTASHGRINPFHVITTLDSDELGEGEEAAIDNFAVHLQFLEEFFRVILTGIEPAAFEYLNNIIVELYKKKGIDSDTNFSKLEATDYPVFDDLYDLINEKLETAKIEYDINNLRTLENYINKFAKGGRNSKLWNGPSTLTVKENFTVFNFQSLLANKNGVIANAQMLLVLKWLDNEIIKNREFNLKYNTTRKIVVCIDEAHVFIDPKYPIALDFMYQLAKRIRKYNGMQIVITQNIKDFVGTADIIRKSTAIINACQYSFIFALAPNDMDDLCTLYEKAGRINRIEQDQIVNNERGHAFIITSPSSRSSIEIVASKKTRKLFGE